MQILFALSFACMVAASLFVGNALSGGYHPYLGGAAALLFLLALFLPFMSEYNILHRGFSKIGDNFRNLMHSDDHSHNGEVEILLPNQTHAPETYHLDENIQLKIGLIILISVAVLLLTGDAVNFYFLQDGLRSDSGPISNF